MMPADVAEARTTGETSVVAGVHADPLRAAPPGLSRRISPAGEAVVSIDGDLDIATAGAAAGYVRDVIDRHCGPVTVDLTALKVCDACGLSALVSMAAYAEQAGRPFRLASPSLALVKLMRITGLDRKFLTPPDGCRLIGQDAPAC